MLGTLATIAVTFSNGAKSPMHLSSLESGIGAKVTILSTCHARPDAL
jgi:hypothetical protein